MAYLLLNIQAKQVQNSETEVDVGQNSKTGFTIFPPARGLVFPATCPYTMLCVLMARALSVRAGFCKAIRSARALGLHAKALHVRQF